MVEDLSPRIGAFGDDLARTPNIDRLAREGARYTHVFATAGVCAPSRAALITGMNQVSITAQHMRTTDYVWPDGSGRRGYEAAPPSFVKAFPELLRAAGYYTTNNSKTDYQVGSPFTVWDENGTQAHWKNRPEGMPFFAMYSLTATHESSLFPSDSIERRFPGTGAVLRAFESQRNALSFRTRPEDVVVPPYYPDTPTVRADIARQYDNVQLMDAWVGERMAELEREGVLDNTIVIWTTDHGDGLPRAKRSLYDSGLNVPMIIRFPDGRGAGTVDTRLISFVDLAPTVLTLAGAERPAHLQGIDMLGQQGAAQARVYAARDRLDESPDLGRAVRTRDFKYIVNERPDAMFYLPLSFRENLPMMAEMRKLAGEGRLSSLHAGYFATPRPAEELYDLRLDPHEVRNLADDPAHAGVKAELSAALSTWRARVGDPGLIPEDQMIKAAWGAESQPQTVAPVITASQDAQGVSVMLASATEGASIGYRLAGEVRWRLYAGPFNAETGQRIEAKATRYGFKESDVSVRTAGD
jgi:arylsulfatase A-like enzyme